MMKFCPKCKSIMMPKKDGEKVLLACSCGHTEDASGAGSMKDKKEETQEVEVVDQEIETLPVTDADCPECGNDKAYYWLQQTRAGDEAETRFLKCTKCKKTWREYD